MTANSRVRGGRFSSRSSAVRSRVHREPARGELGDGGTIPREVVCSRTSVSRHSLRTSRRSRARTFLNDLDSGFLKTGDVVRINGAAVPTMARGSTLAPVPRAVCRIPRPMAASSPSALPPESGSSSHND